MKFCQVAQNYVSDHEDITKIHHDDNIFLLQHKSAIGLFYQINVLNISTDTLNEIFEKVYITIVFMTFVAILHYVSECAVEVSMPLKHFKLLPLSSSAFDGDIFDQGSFCPLSRPFEYLSNITLTVQNTGAGSIAK